MKKLYGYICDHCSRNLELEFELFTSKKKQTKMHFCDERCKLIFLKGRKYYNRKKKLEQEAFNKLMYHSGKCL